MLYHVVGMSKNRVIGKNNKLPWHFSSDLKHFKELTSGSTVIMGRKTFESIGRPLPHRENFVVSKSQTRYADRLRYFSSVEQALDAVRTPDAFIIGGADLFRQTIEGINGIYASIIDAEFEGDCFYPEIPSHFRETSRHSLQDNPRIDVVYFNNTYRPVTVVCNDSRQPGQR